MTLRVSKYIPLLLASSFLALACDTQEPSLPGDDSGGSGGSGGGGAQGGASGSAGSSGSMPNDGSWSIPLPKGEVVFLNLANQSATSSKPDAAEPDAWDLKFADNDFYTNSGLSGGGKGGAFGPLVADEIDNTGAPTIPFWDSDKAYNAVSGWYFYSGQNHALYSRYHTYGIEAHGRRFKLQILSYYGELMGAPTSALMRVRVAEMSQAGGDKTFDFDSVDATAGGPGGDSSTPSACLDLQSMSFKAFTPSQWKEATDWDVCFRRSAVYFNSGASGPGDVKSADLDPGKTADLEEAKSLTPENQLPAFDAHTFGNSGPTDHSYAIDSVRSAFGGLWRDNAMPPKVRQPTWAVKTSDGKSQYVVSITGFTPATDAADGELRLRLRSF